jgi:5-methylcytosine-specific restriction endonuclease McrA
MPKRRDTPCSKCGRLMWWNSRTSRPKSEIVCHPCRRLAPARPGRTVPREEQTARMLAARLAPIEITCESCSTVVKAVKGRRFCDDCRDIRRGAYYREKGARRRAAQSVTGEMITMDALGERDRWTCWICDEFVNRNLCGRDPWMPSFDHVVPISQGGLDSWDNLRLAHLICNVRRGSSSAIVQG